MIKLNGKVTDVIGLVIVSVGPNVSLGEVCTIVNKSGQEVCKCEVVGFRDGKVLSIAGSYKYPGAAALTSQSALIAGAGASILAIPLSAKKLIHKNLLEVVAESYGNEKTEYFNSKGLKSLKQKLNWADVVAIGPGLGREDQTVFAVRELLLENKFKFLILSQLIWLLIDFCAVRHAN